MDKEGLSDYKNNNFGDEKAHDVDKSVPDDLDGLFWN